MQKKIVFVLSLLLGVHAGIYAQRWAAELIQRPTNELSFQDYKKAFEEYYSKNPVDMKRESVNPKFIFKQGDEERDKVDIEEHKMFKRWEWFTEPRVYPSGRWDFGKIDAIRAAIDRNDDQMILKQRELNPLALKFTGDKIFWPYILWAPLGPNDAVGGTNMGRVNCIEFDPSNTKTIYLGAPGGGIWKTEDFGSNWKPIFDKQPTISTGDIAIDKANPKIIYVATSDAFGYGSPFWGGTYSVGVMKSTDAGATWSATGLSWTVSQNRTIRRLVIHPTDGKILLAATSDGVYRTDDAGTTWNKVITGSAFDVEFRQDLGKVAYATTNTVYKSTDAGATWIALSATCAGGRYNIEIAKSNPKTLYTLCTNGTVQKSTDAGATWSTTTAPGATLYGYYDNVLAVSPIDAKLVYVAGFNIRKSTDGGSSWSSVPAQGHVDNHCIEFVPGSSTQMFFGNDGGIFFTSDGGATSASKNKTLAITQFYRLGICKTDANTMISGAQDNGNMKYSAGTFTNITNADGMEGFIDWSNCKTIYAGTQYGSCYRTFTGGAPFTNITPPGTPSAWVTPWCQNPVTANTIYAGTDKVYKSTNQGTAWAAISGVLAGVGQFTVLEVAHNNPQVIYAGDGNKLYRTINAGAISPTWTDITGGLPVASNYLMAVAVNANNPDMAWVTFSGYVAGNKVYKTKDGGVTWANISGTLPNMPVNCVVYENNIKNAVYVGTDAGVYYINDGLADWVPYKFGLPNVIVDELEIHYASKKIRAATYGRGMWQAPLKTP
jgi:photosystem II stability/assembly factor-like uncharacterized protein